MDKRTQAQLAELLSADPAYADHEKIDRVVREILITYGLSVPPIGLEKDLNQSSKKRLSTRHK